MPVASALIGWSAMTSCESGGAESQKSGPAGAGAITAEVMVVKPEMLERKINVTGTILANEEVVLRSETAGRLQKLNFREGSVVHRGTLLAKINDRDLQASLRALQLQDSLLTREEQRKKRLLEIKAISAEEYDQVQTMLQTNRAEQEVVRAQIERTEVIAPFTGVVGLRRVSEGAMMDTNAELATLKQLDPVKIEFAVPERYRAHLKAGTPVSFSVTGVDSVFAAEVYAVEAMIDAGTRTATVRALCPNPDYLLFPGAFARVEIKLESINNALLVPAEAIVQQMTTKNVFVIENGKAVSREVTTDIRTDSRTQIVSGIAPGDSLAVTGLLQLRNGIRVRAIEPTTSDS